MPAKHSSHRSWLRTIHAVSALLFVVLFFAGAVLSAAALMYLGFHFGLAGIGSIRGKGLVLVVLVALSMCAAGLIILWSLLPRIDRFEPPGPELEKEKHPALHREINRIAAMSGEQGPRHAYLVEDVNAFVAERGGLWGIGSQRIMGLGLPLLNVLTVSELRSVLAHEFGHYAGGDTSMGRWIHGTRLTLIRTLQNLGRTAEAASELGSVALVFSVVHAPFRWFFAFYMRFTQALSRRQEFDADALAVRLEGSQALIQGLTKVRQASAAYGAFINGEFAPILRHGFCPPLGHGFRNFMQAEPVAEQIKQLLSQTLENAEKADPYDSHPPLPERIAAAKKLNTPAKSQDDRLGVELLSEVSSLETVLARCWVSSEKMLEPIAWENTAALVEKDMRSGLRQHAARFKGVSLSMLPQNIESIRVLAKRAFTVEQVHNSEDALIVDWAIGLFGDALLVLLLQQNFRLVNRPGLPLTVQRDDDVIEPAPFVARYLRKEMSIDEWNSQLTAFHVATVDFGELA